MSPLNYVSWKTCLRTSGGCCIRMCHPDFPFASFFSPPFSSRQDILCKSNCRLVSFQIVIWWSDHHYWDQESHRLRGKMLIAPNLYFISSQVLFVHWCSCLPIFPQVKIKKSGNMLAWLVQDYYFSDLFMSCHVGECLDKFHSFLDSLVKYIVVQYSSVFLGPSCSAVVFAAPSFCLVKAIWVPSDFPILIFVVSILWVVLW